MKKYGADGVRAGMLFSAPAGNDLLLMRNSVSREETSNKLWNAFRLIQTLEVTDEGKDQSLATDWINSRFNEVLNEVEDHFRSTGYQMLFYLYIHSYGMISVLVLRIIRITLYQIKLTKAH